ncbi:MAG: ANTAR domain-containing protein [Pseudomonadota bacterium]
MFQQVVDPRMRLAVLIDSDPGRRETLAGILDARAISLTHSFGSVDAALSAGITPNLVLFQAGTGGSEARKEFSLLRKALDAAILVLLDGAEPTAVEALLADGADQVLTLGLQTDRFALAAAAALGAAKFRRRQTSEVSKVERRLDETKTIYRAKTILIARHGLNEEDGHRRLQKMSMERNLPLAEMARAIIDAENLLC